MARCSRLSASLALCARSLAALLLALSLGAPLVVSLGCKKSEAAQALPQLGTVGPFWLKDQDGRTFSEANLDGSVWVAAFMFTRCPTVCPEMVRRMRDIQARAKAAGVKLSLVSFSVDPENDTPAALKAYAARFAADESRWKFLTGEKETIFATARGMLVTAIPANDKSPIIHSEKFILVDADGKIRRYYDSTDEQDMTALKQDAAALADEAAATR